MHEDRDPLIRQIHRLAVALAARLSGRVDAAEEVEAAAASVGLDATVAARLPAARLLDLLTTRDGLDAARALTLGLVLADHARGADAAALLAKADALVAAAIVARPALRTAEVEAAWRRLRERAHVEGHPGAR